MDSKVRVILDLDADISKAKSSINQLAQNLGNIGGTKGNGLTDLLSDIDKELDKLASKSGTSFNKVGDFSSLEKSTSRISTLIKKLNNELKGIGSASETDLEKLFPPQIANNIKKASNAIKAYEDAIKSSQSKTGAIGVATKAFADQTKEIKKLTQQLKDYQDIQNGISTKKQVTTEEKGQVLGQYESARAELKVFKEALKEAEDRMKNFKEEKADLFEKGAQNSEFETLNTELKQAQTNFGVAKQKADGLKASLDNMVVVGDLDAQIKEAQEALIVATQEAERLEKNLGEIQMTEANKALEEAKKKLEGLTGVDLSKISSLEDLQTIFERISKDGIEGFRTALNNANGDINNLINANDQMKTSMEKSKDVVIEQNQALKDVDGLKNRIQYFFSLANSAMLARRAIQQAFETVKELDKAMTETAVVTDFSVGDMWEQLPEYSKMAKELGVSMQGVYEASTLYYQQGLSQNEVTALTAETLKMARIAGLECADATNLMTAALRGFNMEINEASAQRVNDVYSELAAITAADTNEIATAMTKTASIANSANMELETTAALLAQMIETTREPAETAGTAMKTIIARFTEMKKATSDIINVDGEEISVNKVEEALKSAGVALRDSTGQFRDLDDVFLDLSKRWDSLDLMTQRYIATTAAGSRQQSRFIAMMQDYDRTIELVDAAYNSAGASSEQFAKTQESLETKISNLKNAWNEFLMGIANSDAIKWVVDFLTKMLNVVNRLTDGTLGFITVLNRLVTTIGLFKVAKGALSTLTAVAAAKTAGNYEKGTAKETFIQNVMPKNFVKARLEKTGAENQQAQGPIAQIKTAVESSASEMTQASQTIQGTVKEIKNPKLLASPAETAGRIIGEKIIEAANSVEKTPKKKKEERNQDKEKSKNKTSSKKKTSETSHQEKPNKAKKSSEEEISVEETEKTKAKKISRKKKHQEKVKQEKQEKQEKRETQRQNDLDTQKNISDQQPQPQQNEPQTKPQEIISSPQSSKGSKNKKSKTSKKTNQKKSSKGAKQNTVSGKALAVAGGVAALGTALDMGAEALDGYIENNENLTESQKKTAEGFAIAMDSAGQGMQTGGMMAMSLGAAFGPWGLAIGAVIGVITAVTSAIQKSKEAEEERKKAMEEATQANLEAIQELGKASKENMDAEKKAREAIEDYQHGEISYAELQGVLNELPEGFQKIIKSSDLLSTSFADMSDAMTEASVEEAKRQREEALQTLEKQKGITDAFFGWKAGDVHRDATYNIKAKKKQKGLSEKEAWTEEVGELDTDEEKKTVDDAFKDAGVSADWSTIVGSDELKGQFVARVIEGSGFDRNSSESWNKLLTAYQTAQQYAGDSDAINELYDEQIEYINRMIAITEEAEQILANTDWTVLGGVITNIERTYNPETTRGTDIATVVEEFKTQAAAEGVTLTDEQILSKLGEMGYEQTDIAGYRLGKNSGKNEEQYKEVMNSGWFDEFFRGKDISINQNGTITINNKVVSWDEFYAQYTDFVSDKSADLNINLGGTAADVITKLLSGKSLSELLVEDDQSALTLKATLELLPSTSGISGKTGWDDFQANIEQKGIIAGASQVAMTTSALGYAKNTGVDGIYDFAKGMAEQYAKEGITDYDLYRADDGLLHHSYTTDGSDAAYRGSKGQHNGSNRFGNRSTDTLTLTQDQYNYAMEKGYFGDKNSKAQFKYESKTDNSNGTVTLKMDPEDLSQFQLTMDQFYDGTLEVEAAIAKADDIAATLDAIAIMEDAVEELDQIFADGFTVNPEEFEKIEKLAPELMEHVTGTGENSVSFDPEGVQKYIGEQKELLGVMKEQAEAQRIATLATLTDQARVLVQKKADLQAALTMLQTEGTVKKDTVKDAANFAIDAYAMESDAEAISADEASNSVVAAMERSNTAVLTLLSSTNALAQAFAAIEAGDWSAVGTIVSEVESNNTGTNFEQVTVETLKKWEEYAEDEEGNIIFDQTDSDGDGIPDDQEEAEALINEQIAGIDKLLYGEDGTTGIYQQIAKLSSAGFTTTDSNETGENGNDLWMDESEKENSLERQKTLQEEINDLERRNGQLQKLKIRLYPLEIANLTKKLKLEKDLYKEKKRELAAAQDELTVAQGIAEKYADYYELKEKGRDSMGRPIYEFQYTEKYMKADEEEQKKADEGGLDLVKEKSDQYQTSRNAVEEAGVNMQNTVFEMIGIFEDMKAKAEEVVQKIAQAVQIVVEAWTNREDILYNHLNRIERELAEFTRLQRYSTQLEKGRLASSEDIAKNWDAQWESLQDQLEMQEFRREQRENQLNQSKLNPFSLISGWDPTTDSLYENREVKFVWDLMIGFGSAFAPMGMGSFFDSLNQLYEDYDSRVQEAYEDRLAAEEAILQIEDERLELVKIGSDEATEFEEKILEALVQKEQEQIDELTKLNESISEANQKLITTLQTNLDKIRQDRENEKTKEDLTEQERRLAYLRQGTGTGNRLTIKDLEEDLKEKHESYTDQLIDQRIADLEKQNELAAEQRQQQIDLLQAQLDWSEKYGIYWDQIYGMLYVINDDGTVSMNLDNFDLEGNLRANGELSKLLNTFSDNIGASIWSHLLENEELMKLGRYYQAFISRNGVTGEWGKYWALLDPGEDDPANATPDPWADRDVGALLGLILKIERAIGSYFSMSDQGLVTGAGRLGQVIKNGLGKLFGIEDWANYKYEFSGAENQGAPISEWLWNIIQNSNLNRPKSSSSNYESSNESAFQNGLGRLLGIGTKANSTTSTPSVVDKSQKSVTYEGGIHINIDGTKEPGGVIEELERFFTDLTSTDPTTL